MSTVEKYQKRILQLTTVCLAFASLASCGVKAAPKAPRALSSPTVHYERNATASPLSTTVDLQPESGPDAGCCAEQ